MTDTPRTNDECRRRAQLRVSAWNVSADFARELERELAAVNAELAQRTAERDEARREICNGVAQRNFPENFDRTRRIHASKRGWDCFDAKEGER